jgi:hypothetical protein
LSVSPDAFLVDDLEEDKEEVLRVLARANVELVETLALRLRLLAAWRPRHAKRPVLSLLRRVLSRVHSILFFLFFLCIVFLWSSQIIIL